VSDNIKKQSNLDRSIDLGMEQFGRFAKRRWFWLIVFSVLLWFFVTRIVPQLTPPPASQIFQYIFLFIFYMVAIVFQFVAIFWFLGRPRLYWVMPGETGVGFKDYKGNPEVLESARRIVQLLEGIEEYQEMGGQPVRGLLLSGPPGTGKSYLAQCISTEAHVPFAYASAASFRAMFIGMDILMIKRLYNRARRYAREYGGCVVFLDEIDAIGMSRGGGAGGRGAGPMLGGGMMGFMGMGTGGLNELLMQLDPPNIETGWFKKILRTLGLSHSRVQAQPVLTIAATNIPESLDPALLRPGRFDRKVHVAAPTDKYRGEVIEYYLDKVKHEEDISLAALVQRFVNYTPVEIKHVINEAVIISHFDGRDLVSYKDLIEAQDLHEFGFRRLSELTPIDKRRLAYHEAGHAVCCYYVLERYFPAYVTIHMRSDLEGAAAFVLPRPKESIMTKSKEDILAEIQVSLAARASEELFLDVNLNGVTSDLENATRLAGLYVGAWGMDGTLTSFAAFMTPLGGSPNALPDFSKRVEVVLQSQMKGVKRLLQNHSEALIAVAEALIERDELVADDIKQLIDDADARRVTRLVMSEFEDVLGNGNGHKNGNGHAQVGSANGSGGSSEEITRTVESSISPIDLPGGGIAMSNPAPFSDNEGPTLFMGG
jgi:cell division protease FtsH